MFQPLPKWEALPASFYSIQKSEIACRLFLRDLPQDLYDYCIVNDVLPPARMRKWRLEKWIEEHRTSARALVTNIEDVPGMKRIERVSDSERGRGVRERSREEFLQQVADARPAASNARRVILRGAGETMSRRKTQQPRPHFERSQDHHSSAPRESWPSEHQ